MPRRKAGDRILGPYREENGSWRVIVIRAGERTSETFASQCEAEKAIEGARSELKHTTPLTVAEAIDEYHAHLQKEGATPRTTRERPTELRRFFNGAMDRSISSLTPRRCTALYDELIKAPNTRRGKGKQLLSAATHRSLLRKAKTFLTWAQSEGLVATNPAEKVKPTGKLNKGKPQLRIDEARKWLSIALQCAQAGDLGALAAATSLLLGLRASEVLMRQVRDLDDDGHLLWIPMAKTANGKRTLEIPEILRPHLQQLCKGKQANDRLFEQPTKNPVKWLFDGVKRICRLAEVPRVCTHSLRGLHSTLSIQAGATPHLVASSLGHGSFAITQQHYLAPGTLEAARQATVLDRLNRSENVPS